MKTWLIEHQVLLSQQIETQKLPHAILISGVTGAGKSILADWLVQVLLCQHPQLQVSNEQGSNLSPCGHCKACLLYQNTSYPDHLVVETDSKTIGVDDIRKANQFFESTALIGLYKSVVIRNAEAMTVSAANALLKTLEEPSNNSIIILTTVESDLLLPTIISRCRLINIRPNNSYSNDKTTQVLQYRELAETDVAEQYKQIEQDFYLYLKTRTGRSQLLNALVSTTNGVRWLEKIAMDMMFNKHGWDNKAQLVAGDSPDVQVNFNHDTLWQIYQLIVACTKQIKTLNQVNVQFAMEKLLIDIYDIVSTKGV